MKKGYVANIESLTLGNTHFRHVLYTAKDCQLVVMSLKPGEDIGMETHTGGDQFFRCEAGEGMAVINESQYPLTAGTCVIIPMGAQHNVINTSSTNDLKLYTIYAPPHHLDGITRATKSEAQADSPEFNGVTSE